MSQQQSQSGGAQAAVYELYPDLDNKMYPFSENEFTELSGIFQTDAGRLAVDVNPIDPSKLVLSGSYLGGINTALAVSSYLNRDFYEGIPIEMAQRVQFTPTIFSYVSNRGRAFNASFVPQAKDQFIRRLRTHSENLRYVVENPSILFLRPQLDFLSARARLAEGYVAAPQPV